MKTYLLTNQNARTIQIIFKKDMLVYLSEYFPAVVQTTSGGLGS